DRDHLEADALAIAAARTRPRPGTLAPSLGLRRRLLARDLAREALARHLVHAEGAHELAQDVVRRQVAVLEGLPVWLDLLVNDPPYHVADHQVLLVPLDHGGPQG